MKEHTEMTTRKNYPIVGMWGHALGSIMPVVEWHILNAYMPRPILLPPPSLARVFYCGAIGSIGFMSLYAITQ